MVEVVLKKGRLVHGKGINDAEYAVTEYEELPRIGVKRNRKLLWVCPYYIKWQSMLERCYNERHKNNRPTYIDCYVCDEWHLFSNFKSWMETQDWEGKHLDKDILLPGNKRYSPETCVFVDSKVNCFMLDCRASRGEYPTGVTFLPSRGKFLAQCRRVDPTASKYIGLYDTAEDAHQAWLKVKLEQASILAEMQTDTRVAKALINRYENYDE